MPVSARSAAHVFRNRSDTFFGVCEAIGQDFGFNANILRIAFGLGVFANPFAVIAIYGALGVAVAVSRVVVPVFVAVPNPVVAPAVPLAVNDGDPVELAKAA